ncbi:restriction endonuclease subunit S [Pseudomonas sp. lyk4-TYG-107]|uniref:restriction endonuclease subunit S n=1 Tax=Pseudomonas sp. lyk4-TYG-107 TaxID=3040317 RepID=UPI002555F181|nr:restriction endonuclease subunit S [Pseudomonas sp. lyk4-TYG-107]
MARNNKPTNIPNGWKYDYLDNFSVRGSGHTPNKGKANYWNGGIKWVSLTDSSKLDNGLIFDTDKEISNDGIDNSSAILHPAGTVILTRDAGVGKSAVLAHPMAVSQHFMAWRCDNKKLNNWFLYNWLQKMKPEFERQAVGSTIKTIGLPYFKKMKIAVPPYPEQEKISKILSTWDAAISTTKELIKKSQQQKKGLAQQLFEGLKNKTEKTQNFKRLGEISDRIQRKSNDKIHPILTISSLCGFVRQDEKYSRFMAGKSLEDYILLRSGEFAYNKGNSKTYEFGCVFELTEFESGLVPHVYFCFKLKPGLYNKYFKYLFEADYLKQQLGKLVNTGIRNNGLLNIKASEFMNTKIPVPDFEEQRRIAEILYIASEEISYLKETLDCLHQEKKALMQQLLTGKIRVKVEAV